MSEKLDDMLVTVLSDWIKSHLATREELKALREEIRAINKKLDIVLAQGLPSKS